MRTGTALALMAGMMTSAAIGQQAAAPPAAAPPSPAPATAAPGVRSVQQDFDAATTLSDGEDPAAAVAAWEALEQRVQRNRRTLAIVRLRKASSLMRLNRLQDASSAAREGLAALPASDASLTTDRAQGFIVIARAAESAIDYAGAAAAYRQAEAIAPDSVTKISALLGEMRTLTFTDPDAAMAVSQRADQVLAKLQVDKGVQAMFASARGVLLMNRGDFAGARAATMDAVKLRGGLTSKTDLWDVSARQDAALALLLTGDTSTARQYMAMTGAGRMDTAEQFNPGTALEPPPCGGEAGLKPADMAVIEFSIADDGSVSAVRPIYAQGGGAVAMEFARAAAKWTWSPENVKALPKFFRYNARLELRCNMAFERPSVMSTFDMAVDDWVKSRKLVVADEPEGSFLSQEAAARAALAKAASGDPVGQLPYELRLMRSPIVSLDEKRELAAKGLAIAKGTDAPESVRLPFDLALQRSSNVDTYRTGAFRRAVTPMLSRYTDPQVVAALRLMLADAGGSGTAQRAYLEPIVADTRLAKNDPLKVGALIRIASLNQSKGDVEGARAAFEASGLAVNQCALLDRPPRLVAAGGSFPQEAQAWGFEGWTQVQYDVGAGGNVQNERVIVSYPPYIFTKAGAATMHGARYTKTFRPDGGLGCGAVSQRVRFKIGM